jgi:hypothetical protein
MALQSTVAAANGFSSAVRDAWLSKKHMPLFTQRSPLFQQMALNKNIQPSGFGVEMREPLMVPVPTGPQLTGISNYYADTDPQPMTGYTTAIYVLAGYKIDVSWSEYDTMRAGSPVEMVQWVQAHFLNAEKRALNKLMTDFWAPPENVGSAGTPTQIGSLRTFINGGYNNAGQAPTDGGYADLPLQPEQSCHALVATSGASAVTTIGTINRSAVGAGYWCPGGLGTNDTSGNPAAAAQQLPGVQALTIQVLNDIYESACQENEEPDIMVTTTGMFSKIQNLLTVGGGNGGQTYGEKDTVSPGFRHVRFRGAYITVDRRCPTGGYIGNTSTTIAANSSSSAVTNWLYCLNSRHLKIRANGRRPKFKTVVSNKAIEEHFGTWYLSFTADHVGNVHSFHCGLTQ